MTTMSSYWMLALAMAPFAVSCLPSDTRDPPGELVVTASADAALTDGFATDDGWSIRYSRFLIVIGDTFLEGDGCKPYNEGFYNRILDMAQPSPQRIGLLYGLGGCEFSFRVSTPKWNTVLGAGVSEADETFLRTAGTDNYATTRQGISVYIAGSAEREGLRKTFAWSLRPFIEYHHCFLAPATPEDGVTLVGEQRSEVDLRIRGTAPFQSALREPTGPLSFEPFREADDVYGDADGAVSLDELDKVPLPANTSPNPMVTTLGARVYRELLTDIVRFQDTGSCNAAVRFERGDFGD